MSTALSTSSQSPREMVLTATESPTHDIHFENVPEALTRYGRWVCWEWHWNGKKWDKIPVQPNGRPASTADASTWNDFSSVVSVAARHGFGIGFVFNGDGLVGIDIDDCRDPATGDIQPWARQFVELLNTYGEVSPSGTGVKLFVRGDLPADFRKKHDRPDGLGAVEIFSTGRYFTVTGQRVQRTPDDVQDRSRELLQLYEMVCGWKDYKPGRGAISPLNGVPLAMPVQACLVPEVHFPATIRTDEPLSGGKTLAQPVAHGGTSDRAAYSDDRATALAALEVLDPDMGYSDWLAVGMALHSVDPSDAMLAEFDGWSSRSAKHVNGEPARKWRSFGGTGVSMGTLCHLADQTGRQWRPVSNSAAEASKMVADRSMPASERNCEYSEREFRDFGSADDWSMPIPLGGDPVHECPLETIPQPARDYLWQLAEFTQTPVDLAVGQFLVACAIALQKKFEVEPSRGWIEPLSLYVLAGMEPANRKSAVVSAISGPLRRYEADLAARLAPVIRASRSAHEVRLKQRAKLVEGAANESSGPEHDFLIHELEELDAEIADNPPLPDPCLLADDITSEHLATKMKLNQGRLGVLTPEGDLFEIMAGRYSKGPNLGIFLKAHCGDEVRVDRGNRPSEHIQRPALSMGFCVQPEVLRGLQEQKTFRGKGLLGRLLFQMPDSLLGRRKTSPPEIDLQAASAYAELMRTLLDLSVPQQEGGEFVPRVLHLASDADLIFRRFREFVEDSLGEFGALSMIKDWGGKLPGAVARIAGLLHLVEHVQQREIPLVIGREAIEHAIRLGHYFTSHAIAAFQIFSRNACLALAEHILHTIQRQQFETFTKRDVYLLVRSRVDTAADLDAPLQKLVDHGFIRDVTRLTHGPGRKPSSTFEVNPHVRRAE